MAMRVANAAAGSRKPVQAQAAADRRREQRAKQKGRAPTNHTGVTNATSAATVIVANRRPPPLECKQQPPTQGRKGERGEGAHRA